MAAHPNGAPKQGLALIGMLLAVVGGMASIVRPMHDQIRRNADKLDKIEIMIEGHTHDGHPSAVKELLNEKIGGIRGNQINEHKVLKEYIDAINFQLKTRYSEQDDAQWERIKSLEREIRNKVSGNK